MHFKYTKEARSLATLLITGVTPFFSTTVFDTDTSVSDLPTVDRLFLLRKPTRQIFQPVNVML